MLKGMSMFGNSEEGAGFGNSANEVSACIGHVITVISVIGILVFVLARTSPDQNKCMLRKQTDNCRYDQPSWTLDSN